MLSWLTIGALLVLSVVTAVKKYEAIKIAREKSSNWPGYFNLFSPFSLAGVLLPSIKGFHRGRNESYKRKHSDFKKYGWNVISSTSIHPTHSILLCADADVNAQITLSRAKFQKPVEGYGVLKLFGRNIVVTEGEEWKKHRRITAPAFSDRNNKLVWNCTFDIMEELYRDVWKGADEVTVDHFLDITVRIALMVLSVAGYGRPVTWTEEAMIPKGHKLTFTDAIMTVSHHLMIKLFFNDNLLKITKRGRHVRLAFQELESYMEEMIHERQNSPEKAEKFDLLTNLIKSCEDTPTGESILSPSEMMGNVFIYLVAGHETTAHTLCYVFGLLALYPDEQDKLYEHIKSVVGNRTPTYEDYQSLNRCLACFYEGLRLYPVVPGVPKVAMEDTVFYVSSADPNSDEKMPLYVKKGQAFNSHTPGMHYNPRYWPNPEKYDPERFLGEWNKDAFIVFSAGARACIGRRFSESEGVAVITSLISKYEVRIKDEPEYAHETIEQRRARIFKSENLLTLTPLRLPLVFRKRK